MALDIVILAAGQGKRMNSALPKVLHPLAGKPLVRHAVDTARSLEPSRVVIVYGHGGETVREALNAPDINFAKQDPQHGTGHAVMQALPLLARPGADDLVLVLYGDVPLTTAASLRRLIAAAAGGRLAILTVDLEDPSGYGRIVRGADGNIERIVEHKDASDAERAIREVNTGIMAIPAARLAGWLGRLSNANAQGEYYLTDIVAMAVADGVAVTAAQPDAVWETLGVNSKVQLAELERVHQRNIAQSLLEQGVTLMDPARVDVRGLLSVGRDVVIDVGCVFEGDVVLGNDIYVGPHCVLKNVRVRAGTRIEAFCHLTDAEIGAHCSIGPYARLRPGAQLDEHVHIGNFVEVKKSTIGAGSKANHLAYVGDSEVGSKVNIGAGTITCNYDGVNKSRTVIGDGAFIGSDATLVAPVTIGAGAYIGAGSTISKEAPAGKLTLTRAEQRTIDNWKPKAKKKA
ncbi:MAG: bifunctional UDP-N-acetylglucosamine diphosphorylase/glucosamine-1-phosphate N-acetyltransferase GlmU [Burkholderiales bacterium]|nr:bifunctional UDP-N-acetylglucosamine diphosphorylase/glucosamine-1-phosphate N-acetyltransferase GlmU [Burkholderiales bacterium]